MFQSLPFHNLTREQKANISFSKYFDPGNTKPDVQSCFSFSTYLATEIAMAIVIAMLNVVSSRIISKRRNNSNSVSKNT